jgi:hypothetical protein
MTSIVYLGKAPKISQVISEDLRNRGITLLKAKPSDIKTQIYISSHNHNYSVYQNTFANFARASETDTPTLANEPYRLFANRRTPPFMRIPKIIWSYDNPLSVELRDAVKGQYGAFDTLAKGKPALTADLNFDQVKILLQSPELPSLLTPGSTSSINLNAFKQYILFHRIFDTVLRVHQYSLEREECWDQAIELTSDLEEVDHAAVGEGSYT